MSKKTLVRQHPRRIPVSKKNPIGVTLVDEHLRLVKGQYLDRKSIQSTFEGYPTKGIVYPARSKLKLPNEDQYDVLIAVWVDYFNKKLGLKPPIDPDMIKALIASESTFNRNAVNKTATGLTQITTATLGILQDVKGESKDFVFRQIRKKDLTDPMSCPGSIVTKLGII